MRRSTAPHQCRGLVNTASQELCLPCHSPMPCISSAKTAPDPSSMDHDTHNLTQNTHNTILVSIAPYIQRHTYMQHQIPAEWIPRALYPRQHLAHSHVWWPRTPAMRRSTAPHQCRGLVNTASQELCLPCHSPMPCISSAKTAPDPSSMDHDTHNLTKNTHNTILVSIALYTQRHTYMQHQIPAEWIPRALYPRQHLAHSHVR